MRERSWCLGQVCRSLLGKEVEKAGKVKNYMNLEEIRGAEADFLLNEQKVNIDEAQAEVSNLELPKFQDLYDLNFVEPYVHCTGSKIGIFCV